MTMRKMRLGAALATATLVSACGGTEVVGPTGLNGLPYGAPGVSPSQSLMFGQLAGAGFTGASSKTKFVTSGSTVTPSIDNATSSTLNFASANSVTVNGQTLTFSSGADVNGEKRRIYTNGNSTYTVVLASDATTTKSVFYSLLKTGTGTNNIADTYIVSGFQTDPAQMPSTTSATYIGPANMLLRQATTSGVGTDNLHVIQSPTGTNLTANFANGTVTGTLSGAVTSNGGINATATTLDVTGTISSNGFSGTTTQSGGTLNVQDGTITGNFYGANVAEIGGTFSSAVNAGNGVTNNTVATGYFLGKQ